MKCYVSGRTCTCDLDEISMNGCGDDVDMGDPFRAGSVIDEEEQFLREINGLANEANQVYS